MKFKIGFLGLTVFCVLQAFALQKEAYPALQRVNMGVYGAEVRDVTAYNNSGSSEILIAVDSIKGVYKWPSGGSFSATALTLPASSASGAAVEVHLVGVDPANVDTLFLAGSSVNPQVYKSVDGGAAWSSSWDFNSAGANNFHCFTSGATGALASPPTPQARGRPVPKYTSVFGTTRPDHSTITAIRFVPSTGGASWSVFSASCGSTHEDVDVLKFDGIMAGTAMGLFSFAEAPETQRLNFLECLKITDRILSTGRTLAGYKITALYSVCFP